MFSSRLVLVPISPNVIPPHPDWDEHVNMTGYWFVRMREGWKPPEDLARFLDQEDRPIAITLGAMSLTGEATRQAALMTLEAVERAGVRAVVQGWDEALEGVRLPRSVYHAGRVPHEWLFSRVAAVVHHGGFGTTSATLRAGVPGVVVPHIIDQLFWAQRVRELGVGPEPIQRGKLSVERLAEAITQALDDVKMQARASQLGRQIRGEPDGVAAAVRLIEEAVSG